jgi:NAD(P)H dehydrogenase (quinone)
MGMPGRRILLTGIHALCAPGCKTLWLALHQIDGVGEKARKRPLARVREVLGRV